MLADAAIDDDVSDSVVDVNIVLLADTNVVVSSLAPESAVIEVENDLFFSVVEASMSWSKFLLFDIVPSLSTRFSLCGASDFSVLSSLTTDSI